MAINLADKYSKQILQKFTKASFFDGASNTDYDFSGVKSIKIWSHLPVEINDYKRNGTNRFGALNDLQDTVQELTLTQDKGFTVVIDNGDNSDQHLTKEAGKVMDQQLKETMVPFRDKYCFNKLCNDAGIIKGITNAPTKANIVETILNGMAAMDNASVPEEDRTIYLPVTYYNLARLSPEFVSIESLGEKAIAKGHVGYIGNAMVKKVPDSYMPNGVYFLITYKKSILTPEKIKMSRILKDVQGIDGAVLEHRNYYDAFVLGEKASGVYAAVKAANLLDAPTVAYADGSFTATGTGTIFYTTDGSDPRYSKSAQPYSVSVPAETGMVFRAYCKQNGMFNSAVAEAKAE